MSNEEGTVDLGEKEKSRIFIAPSSTIICMHLVCLINTDKMMWSKWEWLHIIDTLTELAAVRAESGICPFSMPIGASQSKEKSNKRSKEELDNHDRAVFKWLLKNQNQRNYSD